MKSVVKKKKMMSTQYFFLFESTIHFEEELEKKTPVNKNIGTPAENHSTQYSASNETGHTCGHSPPRNAFLSKLVYIHRFVHVGDFLPSDHSFPIQEGVENPENERNFCP